MPVIEPENRDVKALRGVHLFHSPFSNCSQRTRLVLEEKGIEWESHPIELMAFEHLTDEYQSIHPRGVVPALVHEGTTVVESNDIIRYLDEHFPGPPLMPQTEEEKARVLPWLQRTNELQPAIKTLTYERLFRGRFPPTEEKYRYYAAHQRNPELIEFYRRYLHGFGAGTLGRYEQQIRDWLAVLEGALGERDWLAGDTVTLADFSSVVNVHRAGVMGFDLAACPGVARWYERMKARPSFERAILAYVPG